MSVGGRGILGATCGRLGVLSVLEPRKSGIRLDNDVAWPGRHETCAVQQAVGCDVVGESLAQVHFKDVPGFVSYLHKLPSGSTVLVAWEHKMIGQLARAIDPQGLAPEKYPDHCKSEWTEPEYTEGACYDVIWQFVLHRAHASESWEAKGFSHLHMGFGGRDSSCTEAFQPFSNPTSWLGSSETSETSSTRLIDNTDSTTGALLMLVSFGSLLFLAVGRLGLLHQSLRPGSERGFGKTGTEPLLDTPAENYVTVF